jgi:magnesium-transporting ATPase (P-type)
MFAPGASKHLLHLLLLSYCRAEVPADEDVSALNPAAILGRGKFLSMVMLLAILDPPREVAVSAIKVAHRAGIQVKMITGGRDRFAKCAPAAQPAAACLLM